VITIPFLVLAGASDPIAPLDDLKGLLRRGAWQRFQSLWGRAPGDCHRVAGALVLDLTAAGRRGWTWCRADCDRIGDHSWLECSGWGFDASNAAAAASWCCPRASIANSAASRWIRLWSRNRAPRVGALFNPTPY